MTASEGAPADEPEARRFISSGSPWEAMAGYSRAVVDGDWIFVSGTVGMDARTASFSDSAEAQTEVALDIVEAALRQVPASLMDVIRVRVYVPDRSDVAAVSQVMRRRLGAARATNTTVCCGLAVPEAKVEIEVTARRRPDTGTTQDHRLGARGVCLSRSEDADRSPDCDHR